jgi:hypothetical protein
METIITLNKTNIESEHICCAFSDKKCKSVYELKKDWLKKYGYQLMLQIIY